MEKETPITATNESLTFSVIVLNYNGSGILGQCIESVLKTSYASFEVLIVDNGSTDDSIPVVQRFADPRIRLVISKENLGYAGGNNLGARFARGDILVFLNNDTIVDPEWLSKIVPVFQDHTVGAAQAKLMLYDAPTKLDSAGHFIDRFCISYVTGHLQEDRGQYDKQRTLFGATGAAFAVSRHLFKTLSGFDEEFFILFEESDLCWRIWLSGHQVVFAANSKVYHRGGTTRLQRGIFDNLYFMRRNRIRAMIKNLERANLVKCLVPGLFVFALIGLLASDPGSYMLAYLKALKWNLSHIESTLRERTTIQLRRVVKDSYLFDSGIIRGPRLSVLRNNGDICRRIWVSGTFLK
jgi:GT2 family glycosyltransferase